MRIVLSRVTESGLAQIAQAQTNSDGRVDQPLAEGDSFEPGLYQLDFHIGDYFGGSANTFLDIVPVRFRAAEDAHYHVPLLVSPYGYSTYRGS